MSHGALVIEQVADARVPHLLLPATLETVAIVGDDGDIELLLQVIQGDLVQKVVEFKLLLRCLRFRRRLLCLLQPFLPFLACL